MKAWVAKHRPDALSKCDAFKDQSCPFKDTKTMSDMVGVMEKMPLSHTEGETKEAVVTLFGTLHSSSANVKAQLGADKACPVFSATGGGCPFKGARCSNGTALADALELRSWLSIAGGLEQASERDAAGGEPPATVGISKLLKEGTKVAHKAAENVHYVREFIHGRVSVE